MTLALGDGRTEHWVKKRTGHLSDAMLRRYQREAETVAELHLGWLKPLHEVVPELAKLGPSSRDKAAE